jgi:hypothetical protein
VNPGRRAAASSAAGAAECLKFSEYPGRNLDDDGMGILVLKLTKGYQQSNQEIPGKLSIVVPTAHLERYRSGKDSSMIPASAQQHCDTSAVTDSADHRGSAMQKSNISSCIQYRYFGKTQIS